GRGLDSVIAAAGALRSDIADLPRRAIHGNGMPEVAVLRLGHERHLEGRRQAAQMLLPRQRSHDSNVRGSVHNTQAYPIFMKNVRFVRVRSRRNGSTKPRSKPTWLSE